ncbi:9540_t:CDS:2, partial [Acaulospora morrowiae]
MSPTQAIHLPSPRQILNENYEQASSTNSLTYHNNGSELLHLPWFSSDHAESTQIETRIFPDAQLKAHSNQLSKCKDSQYIVPKPALNRPHSPSPLSMESPMS